jgi:hypothetical protein
LSTYSYTSILSSHNSEKESSFHCALTITKYDEY